MPLTSDQRLGRLKSRTAELRHWRVADSAAIADWSIDGAPICLGAPWPRVVDEVRFSASAQAPADWPLDDARLAINVGGESLLTLRFDGGCASFGLDPNHEEFPIPAHRFSIETITSPRLPFGQPVRNPALNRGELVRIEAALDRLCLRLTMVAEAIEALQEHDVAPHLLDACEEALRMLRWPSATADVVARIASSSALQSIWRLPALVARPAPLTPDERASVAAAGAFLSDRLRELQRRFPNQGDVLLTGHAHIDLAWLWPYGETRLKLRRSFHTALGLMARSADFRFNQSTAHYYAQVEDDDPDLFAAIRAEARAGRWETLGGLWVEPDTNMPTGESLVRQALYGQLYFERTFGARHKVCWLPDCFGFSPALPQILRQAGMDGFCTTKVNWSETNRFPHDLFWWEGLDGSRVLAHTFDNPDSGYNGAVRAQSIVPTWKNFRGKTAHRQTLLSVGYGDGGGGVTPEMVAREVEWRDLPAVPAARWGTVHAYFEAAQAAAAPNDLPVWSGEIYLELHRGALTTQAAVKRLHRRAEQGLIAAEAVASLAHLLGGPAPRSLEPLWRAVLKNEFHDILPGSSIREVYVEAEAELAAVVAAAAKEQDEAMQRLAGLLPRGPLDNALIVANPSLSSRPLRATIDGAFVASDDIVPPLGVAVLDRAAVKPAPGLSVSRNHLENATLHAAIGADGTIASLVHKPTGREALAGRGAQLWVYPQDKPRNWDAWDIEEDYFKSGEELRAVESIEVVESGAHRVRLAVTKRFRDSRVTQTFTLAANGRRLDIETTIDWRDRRTLLRALTPAAVRSSRATFECAYGVIERPTHANTSWDAAMFEAAAHRFVDLSEPGFGLALVNDAKYGHSVRGNVLGLSLARSPIYPDPLADEGEQSFVYGLMPHAGDWREGGVREEAEDVNRPLIARAARGLNPGVATPLVFHGVSAALSALKRAENGEGLVLRVFEPAGARGPFAFAAPAGWRASGPLSLLEEPFERDASADLTPFEIRSWRLQRR